MFFVFIKVKIVCNNFNYNAFCFEIPLPLGTRPLSFAFLLLAKCIFLQIIQSIFIFYKIFPHFLDLWEVLYYNRKQIAD